MHCYKNFVFFAKIFFRKTEKKRPVAAVFPRGNSMMSRRERLTTAAKLPRFNKKSKPIDDAKGLA